MNGTQLIFKQDDDTNQGAHTMQDTQVTRQGVMFDVSGKHDVDGPFPTVRELMGCYMGPNNYMYDCTPIEDWLVVARDPRGFMYGDEDWRAMDVTNYECLLTNLRSEVTAWGWHDRNEHLRRIDLECTMEAGVCQVDGFLIVRPDDDEDDDSDNIATMLDMLKSLSDYPILDDDAYSERENEAWMDYAPMAWSDEVRELNNVFYMDEDDDEPIGDVFDNVDFDNIHSAIGQHFHYNYGFSGDYHPPMVDIAMGLFFANCAMVGGMGWKATF